MYLNNAYGCSHTHTHKIKGMHFSGSTIIIIIINLCICTLVPKWADEVASLMRHKQVEAEAELQGWQGFRSWALIRSHAETTDHSRKLASVLVPVKKIGSHDSIFGLVNSTYFKKIKTNHTQHTFNIKYLANLIKKYWTCFHYQKQIFWCASRPASACRSGGRHDGAILENLLEDQT